VLTINRYFIFTCLWSVFTSVHTLTKPIKAVTAVPVADLLLQRMETIYPGKNTWKCYQTLALEGKKTNIQACPRVHQLLFNEQVTILEQRGDEVLVEIPHLFYLSGKNKQRKYNKYWSHKKNFISYAALQKRNLSLDKIPKPIQFLSKNIEQANHNVVILLFPFHDKKTGRIFSAGTRFVRSKRKKSNGSIAVWALNPAKKTFTRLSLPKKICITSIPTDTNKKRQSFVNIVQRWAHLSDRFIPYVWGGCSFTAPCQKKMITLKKPSTFVLKKKAQPASGFDCTGLVARATQMANIPYFFKNSLTAATYLHKIKNHKNIAPGDLLYFRGHMMIVSDISANKIIEARTHFHGFGKCHEAQLSTIFKGIKNYKQLLAACVQGETLLRLNSNGDIVERVRATFLKLPA